MSVGSEPSAHERYEEIFTGAQAPFAFVDLDAMRSNASDMRRRANGKPIRVASKSVRCRGLLSRILASGQGFRGLMTFTLRESLWLAAGWPSEHVDQEFDDLLLAYPTTDREAITALARSDLDRPPVLTVDSTEHLDLIDSATGTRTRPVRVCIDLDAALWLAGGRVRIGPKRSPVHTPDAAVALAREIVARTGFELAGLMAYEGQVAGVGDAPAGRPLLARVLRSVQKRSVTELAERRAEAVAGVRALADIEIVNGGGTGSLHSTALEDAVTEVTAGSGFFAPTLFDDYSAFKLRPAAMFAMPVVRRPLPDTVTVLGGGYPASGAAGADRLPRPYLPPGLELDAREGAGEVQTPVRGEAARGLRIGDNVYFRHAKAGELCERFDSLYLVEGGRVVDQMPTYRGERQTFL